MTRANKPTRRKMYSMYRGKEIVVTIHPTFVGVRLLGTRTEFTIDGVGLYQYGAKLAAAKAREERLEAKKRKRVESTKE